MVIAGGSGHAGVRIARAVERRGHVAHAWDPRLGPLGVPVDVMIDARPASSALADLDATVPVVDVSVAALTRPDGPASRHAVVGAGWFGGVGDLLVARAARNALAAKEVHVTYWVPGRRSLLSTASDGERRDLWRLLTTTGHALVHDAAHDERVGEARRLAWFPRPVGPHHAGAIAGTEHVTVPQHVPGVDTVRTYVALTSWVAEVAQAIGGVSRLGDVGARLRGRAEGRSRPAVTDDERWACVVEVEERSGDVHRAWAYGTDRHGIAAELATLVALALPAAPPGRTAPAQVLDAAATLDELADLTDLRWSTSGSPGRATPAGS